MALAAEEEEAVLAHLKHVAVDSAAASSHFYSQVPLVVAVVAAEVDEEGAEATKQGHSKPGLTPKCSHSVAKLAVVDVAENRVLGIGAVVVAVGGVALADAAANSIGVVVDNY